MLISCQYCGRIHDSKKDCGMKPKKIYKKQDDSLSRNIRRSTRWTNKSKKIRERDNYQCQLCVRNLHKTLKPINTNDVEVHHIQTIAEHPELAYDETNLITLCEYHHKLAEKRLISVRELMDIAQEQCDKY